jgi:hypothetical protein
MGLGSGVGGKGVGGKKAPDPGSESATLAITRNCLLVLRHQEEMGTIVYPVCRLICISVGVRTFSGRK